MIVALDANCLITWSAPKDSDNKARLDELLQTVSASKGKIIIPMPCFAEYLVGLGDAAGDWIKVLERRKSVTLAPFDRRAAVECALMDKQAIAQGDKRLGRKDVWQRIKIDRQVVAIAKIHQTMQMVSDDKGVCATALAAGISACPIEQLPLPESARQVNLRLEIPH